jgi:hypothetical protein
LSVGDGPSSALGVQDGQPGLRHGEISARVPLRAGGCLHVVRGRVTVVRPFVDDGDSVRQVLVVGVVDPTFAMEFDWRWMSLIDGGFVLKVK